ncbi:MAG: hypothetical protein HYX94_12415 [Chloroflexi bacterium]|nr:hypothetical protein [Chloroflexota bacterium]
MRIFGYIIGGLLLANGLLTATSPRWWTDLSVHSTERVIPQASFMEDFAHLSSGTLRYYGFWETVVGAAMVALASRIPGAMRRPA